MLLTVLSLWLAGAVLSSVIVKPSVSGYFLILGKGRFGDRDYIV